MGAKRFGTQRIRVDGAYVSAALFAVLGSYTLLGSYADSKPVKTYEAGSYHLSEFATKQPNTYKLGLQQGLQYCLSPATSTNTVSSVLVLDKTIQRLSLSQKTADTACFTPTKSYSKIEVQLPVFSVQPTTLSVQK